MSETKEIHKPSWQKCQTEIKVHVKYYKILFPEYKYP